MLEDLSPLPMPFCSFPGHDAMEEPKGDPTLACREQEDANTQLCRALQPEMHTLAPAQQDPLCALRYRDQTRVCISPVCTPTEGIYGRASPLLQLG